MKRGQAIAGYLADEIVEKMEARAHKGHWRDYSVEECFKLLMGEITELKEATKFPTVFRKEKIREEVIDVAAYCAIMLDVLEKKSPNLNLDLI